MPWILSMSINKFNLKDMLNNLIYKNIIVQITFSFSIEDDLLFNSLIFRISWQVKTSSGVNQRELLKKFSAFMT